jgi:MFS family permease
MDRAGAILGPLLAMLVLHLAPDNLRLVFLLGSIPAIIAIALIPFLVENKGLIKEQAVKKEKGLGRPCWGFVMAQIVFTLGNSSHAFLLLKAGESGISLLLIPLLWALYNVFCVLSAPIFGGLSDRWGRKPVLILSFLYYALLYLGFAWSTETWQLWGLCAAYGLYYGLSSGVSKAYLADLIPAEQRGTADGIFATGQGLALLPASIIMGMVWDMYDSQTAFILAAGFSLIGLLIFILGQRIRS